MPKVAPYRLSWLPERGIYALLNQQDERTLPVVPGSTEWFAWLESIPSFTFRGQHGQLTVRREARAGGGGYWYAFHRRGKKMVKRYLGRTPDLTPTRLEEVAREVAAPAASHSNGGLPVLDRVGEAAALQHDKRVLYAPEKAAGRSDRAGQQLGNYRLLRLLGRGGFAEVYLGEHLHLQTPAALKLLRARISDEEATQFLREAQILARLRHRHIMRVLDFAVQEGTPFLVMEFAPGGTMRARYPRGTRLPLAAVVRYVSQVAGALQHAHDQHLIHRDVKPENLLLDADDGLLLSDFGLALFVPSTHPYSTAELPQQVAGTSSYIAPEQLQGRTHPQSDQYALAVVVYEWLAGAPPFRGTPMEVAMQQLSMPPPSLCEHVPDLAPAVEGVVLRALAKAPERRFPSVEDFASALARAWQAAALSTAMPAPAAAQQPSSEPAERTRDDSEEVIAGSVSLPSTTTREEPLWKVPTFLTSLVGREREIAEVCKRLMEPGVRLLTLLGTGGIGKTRLCVEAATRLRHRFAHGVCFVGLAPIRDPEQVLPAIARELDVRETAEQHLRVQVQAALREKHLLLLLDNFEQVAAAAALIEELLVECPSLKIVVTSRAVLHLQAEHLLPVPPLALPDLAHLPALQVLSQYEAVACFVQRAQTHLPTFSLTEANAGAVAGVCVHLDGLPLALELAAARIRLLSPQALLARLAQRLTVLKSGSLTTPERQQTLRQTLQWSYELLSPEEQRLFRRLAVFVGGWTLEAAEVVADAGRPTDSAGLSVLDGVESLLDKSLLLQVERGEEPRLHMLMMVREYALECLASSGEEQITRRAHAAYYLALAEETESRNGNAQQQAMWLEQLEREHENLRAAMRWFLEQAEAGQSYELALRLGGALRQFWLVHGHYSEGRSELSRALVGSEGVAASIHAKALSAAAHLAVKQGDYDQAGTLAEESLRLYRELGDSAGIALSLSLLGSVAWLRGNYAAARSLIEESLALWREAGDQENVAWSLFNLAILLIEQGDYSRGRGLVEEALRMHRELGNKKGIAASLLRLAWVIYYVQGDPATERSLLEEGLALFRELGDKDSTGDTLQMLGWVVLQQGELALARALAEESTILYREVGARVGIAESYMLFARVAALEGNHLAARTRYEESLALLREEGDKWDMAFGLEGLASVVAAQGSPTWAAQLWGAAEALRESIGAPMPPVERAAYEQAVAAIRADLGEKAFPTIWAEGRAMTPKQALAGQGQPLMPAVPPNSSATPVAPTSKPPVSYPAGLTAREVEVLRLVAQGLTDAQVAERLIISPRTVNTHLTSIYNKLGVDSRTAASRFAIEQQLV